MNFPHNPKPFVSIGFCGFFSSPIIAYESMSFAIIGDGRKLLPPTAAQPGLPCEPVTVQLEGIKKMTLRVTRAGGRNWRYLPAVWLDPILHKK